VDRRIVIVGAGDHGRGVLEILRAGRPEGRAGDVIGFLDDAPQKRGVCVGGVPVVGSIDWMLSERDPDISYVIAVADTRLKHRIVQRIGSRAIRFISAIHPSVVLAGGVRIAPGAVLNAGVIVAYDTVIGPHTTLNLNATVGHDCVVECFATVAPGANIGGRARLGEGCDVGPNATVAAGVTLGEWSSIGPASVVIRNVIAGAQVFGNPARQIPASHRA